MELFLSWKRTQERFPFAFLYMISRNFSSYIFCEMVKVQLISEGNLPLKAWVRWETAWKRSDCIKFHEKTHQDTKIGLNSPKSINVLQWFFVTVAVNFTRIFGLTCQSWAIRNYRNLLRILIQNVFLTCAGSLPLLSNSKRFSMIFDILFYN